MINFNSVFVKKRVILLTVLENDMYYDKTWVTYQSRFVVNFVTKCKTSF